MPPSLAPAHLTVLFVVLTLLVASANLWFLHLAAPKISRQQWTARGALAIVLWMTAHAALASTGVLALSTVPPPLAPYLLLTMGTGVWITRSPVGARLARLPLASLVLLQSFRIPLEWILHELYLADALPYQMTWSGYNFDVLTGIIALGLGLWMRNRAVSDTWVWIWNLMGMVLLVTVVSIAVLSTPLPLRQFHNEPAVLLPFTPPFNWIVNVHVFTAFVGHLVIFRALATRRLDAHA